MMFRTLPIQCVDASIQWQFWVHEYINKLLKVNLKLGKDWPKGNPNPETRTNPGHDCTPGLHFW